MAVALYDFEPADASELGFGCGDMLSILAVAREATPEGWIYAMNAVGSGVGLAIVPRWASRLAVDGVVFVPLSVPPGLVRGKLALSVVWLRDTRHPARDAFLDVLDASVDTLSRIA